MRIIGIAFAKIKWDAISMQNFDSIRNSSIEIILLRMRDRMKNILIDIL